MGGGKFRPLSLETQRMLESAVLSGHDEAMFKVKKASYTVDLKTMMQTNTFSGKSRALRRREVRFLTEILDDFRRFVDEIRRF